MKEKCKNCIIGLQNFYCEIYSLRENDIQDIDWNRLSKYNYCPICGRKIHWEELEKNKDIM